VTADSHALAPLDQTGLVESAGAAVPTGHVRSGISNPVLGMLLFLTSEVMFFAGLFAAYFSTRAQNRPWPPAEFDGILNPLSLILVATVILITSSFTCQFAVWSIRRGDRRGYIRNISATFVLGIAFLLLQAYDYSLLFGEGMTMGSGPFGTTYFTLTGFHGAHVFGGVLMLGVILYRGMLGQFSDRHHDAVEAVSLYWHFVDVVWILLFSVLYLL
jgi:cytochrome c oxidase subunit III